MKRDLEIIKELLIYVEQMPPRFNGPPQKIQIAKYDHDSINYHLTILLEAGYVHGVVAHDKRIFPERLTWEGHDFLEAARNDTIWKKTMTLVKSKGGNVTIEVLKALLIDQLKTKFGLDPQ